MKYSQKKLFAFCLLLSISTISYGNEKILGGENHTLRFEPSTSQVGSNSFGAVQKGNKIISECWTVQACSQMISDCISVGGTFYEGVSDVKTWATSEGYCRL